jgi:hypothetical protein
MRASLVQDQRHGKRGAVLNTSISSNLLILTPMRTKLQFLKIEEEHSTQYMSIWAEVQLPPSKKPSIEVAAGH